ncbi:MAG: nitrile hydratase subunit beta [Haloferacaceae archaeon]
MDGIHDLGGMHGFGAVDAPDETPFHHDWERRTFAADVAALTTGAFGIDEFRYAIERLDPVFYLSAPYYEKWLTAIERLSVASGLIDGEEYCDRVAAFAAGEATLPEREDPDLAADLTGAMGDAYAERSADADPAFAPGDAVVARETHPEGHTRCPRYVRGVRGRVETVRGSVGYPDAGAARRDVSTTVYNVAFDAEDVWGEDCEGDRIRLDLWEPYLRPVEDGTEVDP